MTDRTNVLHVALDREMRVDDVQYLLTSIGSLKGVAAVTYGVDDGDSGGWAVGEQVKKAMRSKLMEWYDQLGTSPIDPTNPHP